MNPIRDYLRRYPGLVYNAGRRHGKGLLAFALVGAASFGAAKLPGVYRSYVERQEKERAAIAAEFESLQEADRELRAGYSANVRGLEAELRELGKRFDNYSRKREEADRPA